MTDPDDPIARTLAERKEGAWPANAARRRSAWNWLLPALFLPLWLGFLGLCVEAASQLHVLMHPGAAGHMAAFWRGGLDGPRLLILIPLLIATLAPALMLANFLIYRIPPARRALQQEGRGHAGADYDSSQRTLFRFGVIIAALAAIPVAIGAWLS